MNNIESIDTVEGINLISEFYAAKNKCVLPKANRFYLFKSDELMEYFRINGHPVSFLQNKETYDLLCKDLIIKFDDINEDSVKNIIFVNYATHEVLDIYTQKICNLARYADKIGFTGYNYNNFEEVLTQLFDKKLITKDLNPFTNFTYRSYDLNYLQTTAKIVFSNEDFYTILENVDVTDSYVDSFKFGKEMKRLNIYDLNQYLRTDEEKRQLEEEQEY